MARLAGGPAAWAQTPLPATCEAWRECRAHALEAESRGDFEAFHDLAWRTMQRRGTPADPEVMLLLARAQASSGRPHDALVMLRRIAELGVAPTDALTDEKFARSRALPDWPQVEALIVRPSTPAGPGTRAAAETRAGAEAPAAALAAASAATVPSSMEAPSTPAAPPVPEQLLKLGRGNIVPGGVAYDAASGRVLVGNRLGKSVITISERLQTSMDLVRAASAGFHEVLAIAIDARRGDLWVASAAAKASPEAPGAALHKLQLVSGRPLATIPIDTGGRPVRFTGLVVTPAGTVFMLDGESGRLWKLAPDGREVSLVATLALRRPSGLAIDERGSQAYVAHDEGLGRLALANGAVASLSVPTDVSVSDVESLEWHKGSLIAVQRTGNASRQLVRWRLNRRGSISGVDVLDPAVKTCTGGSATALSGDDVYYLAADGPDAATADGAGAAPTGGCMLVVRRLRLP